MRITSGNSLQGKLSRKLLGVFMFFATTCLFSFTHVFGDIYVTASESDGNTTIEWSGSLNVSGFTTAGEAVAPVGSIFPKMGMLSSESQTKLDVYLFRSMQLRPFGKGIAALQTSGSGDPMLITNTVSGYNVCVCLPSGYNGGQIKGKLTIAKVGLSDLGIDTTPFSYDLGGQSIHFFPTPDSLIPAIPTRKKPIKEILSKVLPNQEDRLKIKSFRLTGKNDLRRNSEIALVEVRPLKTSDR